MIIEAKYERQVYSTTLHIVVKWCKYGAYKWSQWWEH